MKTQLKLGALCAALAISAGTAHAVDVLFISNSGSANTTYQTFIQGTFDSWTKVANGTGVGQVGGDLDRVTDFPVSGSHGGTGITVRAYLESFDLIINGVQVTSTAYQDGATPGGSDWAGISKPILFHSALAARELGGRPGMFTGDNNLSFSFANPDDTQRVSVSALADSIFGGVSSETDLYDSAALTSVDTINIIADAGDGEIISHVTDGVANHYGVVFWEAGTSNGAGLGLAGRRAFFPLKNTASPEGFNTLTADGQLVLENLMNELLEPAPEVLLPPTSVIAKSGVGEINLSWAASAGAVSYNVKRSLTPGSGHVTVSTPGTVTGTTYTDPGLTNGITYYYVVSAVKAGPTESVDSIETSAIPVPVIEPSASILYVANANSAAYENFATNGQFANNVWTQKATGTGNDQIGGDLDRTANFTGLNGGTGISVKQYLQSFDLIIIGLPSTSSNFIDGANGADWAQISKPVLFNTSFAARALDGRTGMFAGEGTLTQILANPLETVRISASALSDDIFNGVSNVSDLYAAASTDTINGLQLFGTGERISTVTDGVIEHHGIVYWDSATTNGAGHLMFEKRAYLPLKGQVNTDLNADGLTVLGNLFKLLLVPSDPVFPPPSDLVAKSGVQEINLTWTASPSAVSYNVKRAEIQGGPYTDVSSPGAVTTTSYTDTGLTNGTTYYYVVSAVDSADEESADSLEASAVPVPVLQDPVSILYIANASATSAAYEDFATNGQFANNTWTIKPPGLGNDQIGGDLDRLATFTGTNGGVDITVRSYLESFDLIIIGIPTTSSNFTDGVDGDDWANLAKPILFHAAVATRSISGRPGLFSGDNFITFAHGNPDDSVRASTSALADAILAGVSSETDLYVLSQTDTINNQAQIGMGEAITRSTNGSESHQGIVFWANGDLIGRGITVFGNRAFMPLKGSIDDLTDDGKLVLGNLFNAIVTEQTTTGSAYGEWAALNISLFDPMALASFDQDTEDDGLANGLEWVLGGDPLANDAGGVLPVVSGDSTNGLTLVFNRSAESIPGTTLSVEWGVDLEGFTQQIVIGTVDVGPAGDNPTVDIDAPSVGQVTVNIPSANAPGGKVFARVKAESNP